jgi:hypothetical protein
VPFLKRLFSLLVTVILTLVAVITIQFLIGNYSNAGTISTAMTPPHLNLYKISIYSYDDADALKECDADVFLRVAGGYLVIAGFDKEKQFRTAGLEYEFIAADVDRYFLALDFSRDGENLKKYPLVYAEDDVRIVRIDDPAILESDEVTGLAPVLTENLRVIFKEPTKLSRDLKAGNIDLETVISQVDENNLLSSVTTLQSFPPRLTGTLGDYDSRDWIEGKLVEFGLDSIVLDPFYRSGNLVHNIIAYKPGTEFPDHHIIIGAHKDAVEGSPGADDNGSGTAGVLEIARIIENIDTRFTFVFILFDAEEQGLHGAWHYANRAAANGDSIIAMLNMDMIGHIENTDDFRIYHGSDVAYPQLCQSLATSLSEIGLNGYLGGSSGGSDHYAFQQNGYDIIYLAEYIFSSVYHSPNDNTSYMDFSYMSRIVKAILATACEIDNTYMPQPGLVFDYPVGQPGTVMPETPTTFEVQAIGSSGGEPVPNSGILYYRPENGSETSVAMAYLGGDLYEATIPAFVCDDNAVEYWISVDEFITGAIYDGESGNPFQTFVATETFIAFEDDFETDKGWTISGGEWARGSPTGNSSFRGIADPVGGYNSQNAMGYNLYGDYTNSMPEYYVTPPLINCQGMFNVHLEFYRWLGVSRGMYDQAKIEVGGGESGWTTIWENTDAVGDRFWTKIVIDISDYADNNPSFPLRWTMGPTSSSGTSCGWNIDDVKVIGFQCDRGELTILTEAVSDWTVGFIYNFQLEGEGGVGLLSWSDISDILGQFDLGLSTSGLIWGVPNTVGEISFTARMTDATLNSIDKQFLFTINSPVSITTDMIDDGQEGVPYSFQIISSGGSGEILWNDRDNCLIGTGLSLATSGLLSGTPIVYGLVEFTARVEDQPGSFDERAFTIDIIPDFNCGDTDNNGIFDLLDIIYMIDFKFKDGPPPEIMLSADVNNDTFVDILDITAMIDKKFKFGPDLHCPGI